MSGIHDFIDNEVKTNDVVLFLKGTPEFPQCGFSGQVVQILDYVGVDYKGINVEEITALRVKFREAGVDYVVLKNSLVRLDDQLQPDGTLNWSAPAGNWRGRRCR